MITEGTICYLAGPITGRIDSYEREFNAAAMHLKNLGAVVLNPAMLPIGLKSHDAYMRICLPMLREADAIVMLPGWEESKGANLEFDEARKLGLKAFVVAQQSVNRWQPLYLVAHG